MPLENIQISVVIPTFKRPHFIKKAIDSVIAQTFSNWELIVVDDNPKDSDARKETVNVLREYESNPRISYILQPENKGGSAARNTGIKQARGEYIAFLDDDDLWLPEKLEAQMKCFEEGESSTGLVYTGHKTINEADGEVRVIKPKVKGDVLERLLGRNYIGTTSTILCKKKLLLEAGLFDEQLPARQDIDLYLRLARICTFDYVSEPLVIMVKHGDERITNDSRARAEAFRMMFLKYGSLLGKSKEAHSEFIKSYGKELLRAGNKPAARAVFLEGLRFDPFNIKLLGKLLRTFF
jgi:glycosyltransferase involved in cell wall biosynthesis